MRQAACLDKFCGPDLNYNKSKAAGFYWAFHQILLPVHIATLRSSIHKLNHSEMTISKQKDIRTSLGQPHFPVTKTKHHDLLSSFFQGSLADA